MSANSGGGGETQNLAFVAVPVAFQQNHRDEVRLINGDGAIAGALAAEAGMKQQNYVGVPVAFQGKASSTQPMNPGPIAPTLDVSKSGGTCVAFQPRIGRNGRGYSEGVVPAIGGAVAGATSDMRPCVTFTHEQAYKVRRLSPVECLRLQNFPDNWFDGLNFSDSVKYKCLGNAVCVAVSEWIARRIWRLG